MKQSKGSTRIRNCHTRISSPLFTQQLTRTRLLEVDDVLDSLDSLLLNLGILRLAVLLVPSIPISLLPPRLGTKGTHASVMGNKSRTALTGCLTHARSSSSRP